MIYLLTSAWQWNRKAWCNVNKNLCTKTFIYFKAKSGCVFIWIASKIKCSTNAYQNKLTAADRGKMLKFTVKTNTPVEVNQVKDALTFLSTFDVRLQTRWAVAKKKRVSQKSQYHCRLRSYSEIKRVFIISRN